MKSIRDIQHPHKHTKNGALVLLLNTEGHITPEAEAMLQALHSRSTGGIFSHLDILAEKGAEKFMGTFYVGYGHKSIGDCGTVTLFIEGVSLLVAKAIQQWPLYSGQESSTRYIDFTNQAIVNPANTKEGTKIQEEWRSFYLSNMEAVRASLQKRFPRKESEDEKVYKKAIAARAFDIMRGFLPAGVTTNLAWHMNLRQLADEIALLRHHPLTEVREVAETAETVLALAFPSSFSHKRYEKTGEYNELVMQQHYYHSKSPADFAAQKDTVNYEMLETFRPLLEKRPLKTELPQRIKQCGTVRYEFLLDFGSWRDLQRHRAVLQEMPLLTTEHGFHPWYLAELPEEVVKKATALLQKQEARIAALTLSLEETQNYIPLGYQVPAVVTGDLHALTYLVELRTTPFVHPTLRERALQIAEDMRERFGKAGLILHTDPDPHRFDIRRGEQDIVQKSS